MSVTIFSKDYLVKHHDKNGIVTHSSNIELSAINKYAKKSLEIDNDAKKRSKDEAISIHIITDILNTRLSILYESQICGFYGKPDFIIKLGRNLYIMVSTTRAVAKHGVFDQNMADRLMKKKLLGLSICAQNLECLVDDVLCADYQIRPVLHVLAPNVENANLCNESYQKLLKQTAFDINTIKIVITDVKNHFDWL